MNVKISRRMTKPDFPSEFLASILKANADPTIISFAGGLPNAVSFPVKAMEAAAEKVLKENGIISEWTFPRHLDGEISTQQKILRSFHKYCKYHMIPHTTLYELRHTYVSVNKEMPTELLKAQVGHSSSMPTLDVYGHELQGERERAADYSTEAFRKIIGERFPEQR